MYEIIQKNRGTYARGDETSAAKVIGWGEARRSSGIYELTGKETLEEMMRVTSKQI